MLPSFTSLRGFIHRHLFYENEAALCVFFLFIFGDLYRGIAAHFGVLRFIFETMTVISSSMTPCSDLIIFQESHRPLPVGHLS